MPDIREHLQADLLSQGTLTVGGRVYQGMRPQATALPCLVWRCTKAGAGEDLAADSGERDAKFEIVIWAATLQATLAFRDALEALYHGTEGYEFGVAGQKIEMGSCRKVDEYDGDRVADTYDDGGAFPLTMVFEFMWDE